MENFFELDYSSQAPSFSQHDSFVRIKPPKAIQNRPRRRRDSTRSLLPGGIRQRRNKRWNW